MRESRILQCTSCEAAIVGNCDCSLAGTAASKCFSSRIRDVNVPTETRMHPGAADCMHSNLTSSFPFQCVHEQEHSFFVAR